MKPVVVLSRVDLAEFPFAVPCLGEILGVRIIDEASVCRLATIAAGRAALRPRI